MDGGDYICEICHLSRKVAAAEVDTSSIANVLVATCKIRYSGKHTENVSSVPYLHRHTP